MIAQPRNKPEAPSVIHVVVFLASILVRRGKRQRDKFHFILPRPCRAAAAWKPSNASDFSCIAPSCGVILSAKDKAALKLIVDALRRLHAKPEDRAQ